ncbi:uncharacterized protein LOC141644415 [Silene latifolia]|uniref:uncharacterized protein LOC141644415 n=1 Tax=Silene latifolia TaxID=37657 RepID=UPI003D76EBEE
MKLNKSKNKGKVHPSPSSLSSNPNDTVSTLNKLLPAAILTLISILSLQDQEVLAYMITHSLSSSSPFFTSSSSSSSRKNKKVTPDNNNNNNSGKKLPHKVPCFDCGCFDCYTSYWFRWDSSPHRELIHQAIEAFEEHLSASEQQISNKLTPKSTRKNTHKLKKSDASCSLFTPEVVTMSVIDQDSPEIVVTENGESSSVKGGGDDVEVEEERESGVQEKQVQQQQQQQHKGLARKVLPDVIGLFNSRLWNLWGPNV